MTDTTTHSNGDVAVIPRTAISVAVINDYEVVVRGVGAMLAPYEDRVQVVELRADGGQPGTADVALFDTFAGRRQTLARAAEMVSSESVRHVVLYTWDAAPEFVKAAYAIGMSGLVFKTRSADVLVDSLERIVKGEKVGFEEGMAPRAGSRIVELSDRESEVLALITQGKSNAEIAALCYLSINTVKSYVRSVYRKIGVESRTQAVLWGVEHGFRPDHRRIDHWRGGP